MPAQSTPYTELFITALPIKAKTIDGVEEAKQCARGFSANDNEFWMITEYIFNSPLFFLEAKKIN